MVIVESLLIVSASKNAFLGKLLAHQSGSQPNVETNPTYLAFAGIVTGVAAWSIWGSDVFPQDQTDPKGNPEEWTREEMRRWLKLVSFFVLRLTDK